MNQLIDHIPHSKQIKVISRWIILLIGIYIWLVEAHFLIEFPSLLLLCDRWTFGTELLFATTTTSSTSATTWIQNFLSVWIPQVSPYSHDSLNCNTNLIYFNMYPYKMEWYVRIINLLH